MENVVLKLLEEYKKLTQELLEAHKQSLTPHDKYSSDETKDLYAAIAQAQGEYPPIGHNRQNPFFKSSYADWDSIVQAVRPCLKKHGLSFIQQIRSSDAGTTMLHSILTHATGQWIESRMRIVPPKNDPQSFGSTLSYCKRYVGESLLGITTSSDINDDDAEEAMKEVRYQQAQGTALKQQYNPKAQSFETLNKDQIEELELELRGYPDIAQDLFEKLNVRSIADLPKSQFNWIITRVRERKQIRNKDN